MNAAQDLRLWPAGKPNRHSTFYALNLTLELYATRPQAVPGRYLRSTAIGNILNQCALSIPCRFTSAGLPIGLMLYAKPFDELALLRTGHALFTRNVKTEIIKFTY